ncbi:hypothetical protein BDK51DRAFT_45774 [Blyttiomyces helicus]|uniref:Uncharacterized protein n=1 Tax=Blyttiomyces helicus TaxID=388810 RepID=A0A4P9VTF9_9FUNG|nr:hypothetical protein BDK51DRAFT_45774 [Blyttiomyces helicus]|eukprot:RKO82811.1 hypothetical protein BDK51DRAFT_45774 [Blyttiomyces helicus]
MSLSSFAYLFESCPNLALVYFVGVIKYREEITKDDIWKTSDAGKAISESVRRLQSLGFQAQDIDAETAIYSATGPYLMAWTADRSAAEPILPTSNSCWRLPRTHRSFNPLIDHCLAIEELHLTGTAVTVVSIHALKPHRPLTRLALSNDDLYDAANQIRLFATATAEPALAELLSARGGSLALLCIGMPGWRMGLDVAIALMDSCTNLRTLHLIGSRSASSIAWLTHRMPALRHLEVDDPDELEDSVPPRVSLHSPRWSDQFSALGV